MESFQDLMVALDTCYWLHKAISIGLLPFGDDRRCHLADSKQQFPASQKILFTVWFICIVLSKECKGSVVHTWICLTKKNLSISSVYIFDGLYSRVRRGSTSKQQGEKSSLMTILFSLTCDIPGHGCYNSKIIINFIYVACISLTVLGAYQKMY